MQLSFDRMYQASLEKDVAFEGVFFTAVKTTGIFCRPSCRARKPKPENIEFFATTKECILKGYRPCKVCHPLEQLNQTPDNIRQLLLELAEDPGLKVKDADLLRRGIEPHQIRRWFLKNHGITFHAYRRMLRINSATANNLFETNYNCWTCALAVTHGETPGFSTFTSESQFVSDIQNNYVNVSGNPSSFKFGQTAISFGYKEDFGFGATKIVHGAVYLGTSKDGTQYVWTKDGKWYPPRVATLK
ncbi:Methylphosphotriester-DNA--protein-cysteine methyltransferase (N-terminal fragment of Ada), contains Zn-binding and two AraC-type DNA-binding domains [Chitinophaga terrae (ex Kim and Jung 2007)]|uniref:Methylphosphotriester-DNA--protein-cysteine methyltransferase (N-terminal of Ada), contains Zn-binding and two AraC-type DNA-binding domains n=1 Tax=Chitinophaga terrae (ex Kim and Jung 2007) TaxID=408074 RepID=A0A1H3X3F1_9BACT|nr:Ada metal-binding domain-containing protein [Chitinophaga terrae (ex Kim and Jung 2007)]GEP89940.1 hypothetical protein CTE07_15850 [Chitinophaga terrae (ex Kim and Jung 2007)]SDZ93783.1 Methylphosphotriester-DNA--protein-cysteine methyltransferase (N-terminal fragment of Ada), contains Zn-binding and two AraC-type DNA-binding domains [Chitinophaga terrae (ex Kim and Jung 2007)]